MTLRVVLAYMFLSLAFKANSSDLDVWLENPKVLSVWSEKPLSIKFSHPAPDASKVPVILEQLFGRMSKETHSGISVQQYGGGRVHDMKGGFKAVRGSLSDFATCYSVLESKGFEYTKTFHQPFLVDLSSLAFTKVMSEFSGSHIQGEFNRRKVHYGFSMALAPMNIMSAKPIRTLEDLKGTKIATIGVPPSIADSLDFNAVSIPFPELYTSLQQGVVDGVLWSDMGFVPFKIYEQAKFYTEINLYMPTLDVCVNRNFYKSLSAVQQSTFDKYLSLSPLILAARQDQFIATTETLYKEHEVQRIQLSKDEKKRWMDAIESNRADWFNACADRGKDCKSLTNDIQVMAEKYQDYDVSKLMDEIKDL